jgi:hypothetical protein
MVDADYEGLAGFVHVADHFLDPLLRRNFGQRRDATVS